jgi:hypothetical protein
MGERRADESGPYHTGRCGQTEWRGFCPAIHMAVDQRLARSAVLDMDAAIAASCAGVIVGPERETYVPSSSHHRMGPPNSAPFGLKLAVMPPGSLIEAPPLMVFQLSGRLPVSSGACGSSTGAPASVPSKRDANWKVQVAAMRLLHNAGFLVSWMRPPRCHHRSTGSNRRKWQW